MPEGAPDAGQDDIHRILNDIGVDYTHRNEHLIKSNAIEERRVQALLEVRHLARRTKRIVLNVFEFGQEKKKAKQQAKERAKQRKSPTAKDESPQPSWPPKRRHHKPPMTAEQKSVELCLFSHRVGYQFVITLLGCKQDRWP